MTFQEWVKEQGGQRACAKKHNFSFASIGSWFRLERYPKPTSQQRILECSAGRVDFLDLLKKHIEKNSDGNIKTVQRRLKASVLVRDLARLKQVYDELGLPSHRCNLHGPKILARWENTHVTVDEVRRAVCELEDQGKDSGDIELIHKTVGEARKTALGRLEQ